MTGQDDITTFLDQWSAAEAAGDTDALAHYLTDDYLGVGPLGFTLSKQAWRDRHAPGGMRYESFQLQDVQVRTYGDVAVVVAIQTGDATYAGHPAPDTVRVSLTLVRTGDGWRLAGNHMSFVAGTRGAPPIPGRPPEAS